MVLQKFKFPVGVIRYQTVQNIHQPITIYRENIFPIFRDKLYQLA